MKAAIYRKYGPPSVVSIGEVPKPVPKDDEVLVRIVASTVTTGDYRARSLRMPPGFGILGRLVFGLFGPRKPVLGTEFSGDVDAVGKAVTRFRIGDPVFGFTGARFGAHAEYLAIAEDGTIAPKPANLSYGQAAALSFGGTTALGFLRDKGGIKPGDKVLVVGASGGVGSAAVQIARHFGAEVTGVCSTANVDLVRSLGAQRVIDYTKEDLTRSGETYDIILDTTGTAPLARSERLLKPGGRLLIVLASLAQTLGLQRPAKGSGKKAIAGVVTVTVENVRYLGRIAAAGEFTPAIDRVYPLEEAAAAHALVDSGRKRGNVILTIARPMQAPPSV